MKRLETRGLMTHFMLGATVWLAAAAPAPAAERSPVHPGLTREQFVLAKSATPAGQKNGELGDAAARSDLYDMLRCEIALTVDPDTTRIDGAVKMVFASRVPALDEMVFDLRFNLAVLAVDHADGPLLHVHDADSVIVSLPAALGAGEVDSFTVVYGGEAIQPLVNRGLMYRRFRPDPVNAPDVWTSVAATMSEPAYAQAWWPCKDKPGDKFRMTMDLTVPETMIGVSNGELFRTDAAGPGWTTYRWRHGSPIAAYLVSIAVSDYELLHDTCTTGLGTVVPLRNWVFPGDVAAAAVDFAPLCEMVDFCESVYGAYPYAGERYGHAEFIWPGAMEHPTVTSIGSGALAGDGSHDWLIVHELGHQWFGDSLTPATWADIWLNEGFATYTEALWAEHRGGETAYRTFLDEHRSESDWTQQGPVFDPMPVFPGRVIYDKGAWILHALRGRLGDAAFFGLIDAWSNTGGRRDGTVTTQAFIDLAGVWAGQDLGDFLWPYLTETDLPGLAFSYRLEAGDAGPDTRVRVTAVQTGPAVFDLVVPVVVSTAAGDVTSRMHLDEAREVAVIDVPAAVQAVAFDPLHEALWRPDAAGLPVEGLTGVQPNPSRGGYVQLSYWLDAPRTVQIRIYDARGRRVAERTVAGQVAGNNAYGWDVSAGGARVASGVYWAAMEIDGRRSVQRFTVVR